MPTEIPMQMAFDLFQDNKGLSITDAPLQTDIQFRKNNQIISLRADIGLLARKMLNACLFIARPNITTQDTHVVDIEYFKWLCNYDSTNHKHLRAEFKKVRQAASFEIDFIDDNNASLNGDGGEISIIVDYMMRNGKVAFSVNPRAREAIANPLHYTWLSLRITNSFTSEYALVIYELLSSQKYKGYSDWYTVDVFRLKTNTAHLASYDEFKFLRTRVINPAIKQINENSDIHITLETGNNQGSKKIARLRFKIEPNPNGKYQISLPKTTSINEELFKILRDEFGLSRSQIEMVGNSYEFETIKNAIDFVTIRKNQNRADNPGGLLIWALKEQVKPTAEELQALATVEQKRAIAKAAKDTQVKQETENKTKHSVVFEHWKSMPLENQKEVLATFAESDQFLRLKKIRKTAKHTDLENKLVMGAFTEFLKSTLPE